MHFLSFLFTSSYLYSLAIAFALTQEISKTEQRGQPISNKDAPLEGEQASDANKQPSGSNRTKMSISESLDRSSTHHVPYPDREGHRHHSPYVHMVFRLANEAVAASEASRRISHQLSSMHHHADGEHKRRVPLYKQSYPVLYQHGHIMHSPDGELPYPYIPTMKAHASILHGGHQQQYN